MGLTDEASVTQWGVSAATYHNIKTTDSSSE